MKIKPKVQEICESEGIMMKYRYLGKTGERFWPDEKLCCKLRHWAPRLILGCGK